MKLRGLLQKAGTITLAAALVFSLGACGSAEKTVQSGAADTAAELKTVKIAVPGQNGEPTENALLAKRLGYIDEELASAGYKAEYLGFAQAGPAINEAFAAKEIDYAFYNEIPAITAKSNGIDLKILAAVTQQYNYALFATDKSGIQSVKDLEGKKVIVIPGTILYKYFVDLCQQNDVDISKVETINALADANSVLNSGEADAYISAYSSAIQLEKSGLGKIIVDTTNAPEESTGIALVARKAYLENEEESAKALIRALKRASEYAAANPKEALKNLETEVFTTDVLERLYGYDEKLSAFNPAITDEYLEKVRIQYEFTKSNQMIASEFALEDLIDSSYAEAILTK